MNKVNEHQYLIIGGSTKCGTTSLFKYLADHPEICAGSIKESRFFLSQQNSLKSRYRLEKDAIQGYENIFNDCSGKTRMEATPDYLYSCSALNNIRKYLPDSKIVFILRDPVERLKSWYKFARQRALLDKSVSFEDYVIRQMNKLSESSNDEQHMRALEQGKYSKYLDNYFATFGKGRVLVLSFNDLKSDPTQVLKCICRFAKIDESVYDDYRFEVFNKSQAVRNQPIERIYIKIRKSLRFLFHGNRWMMKILKQANKTIRRLMRFNQAEVTETAISDELKERLDAYYSDERAYMDAFFNR